MPLSSQGILKVIRQSALIAVGIAFSGHMAWASPMNLIKNGSFEIKGDNAVPSSWAVTGAAAGIGQDTAEHTEGAVSLKIQSPSGNSAQLSQTVDVPPGSQLLFTADVRSDGQVVATVNGVRMSYHRQGQWQRLAGLIRPGDKKSLTITFDVASLTKQDATTRVDNASLVAFEAPKELVRKYDSSQTVLVQGGKPMAALIYPSAPAEYKVLARRVQKAIQDKAGVALPIVSDIEATESGPPILKQAIASQNLIILGRLGINRALWPAYNRFLAATDGYYPGGNGYEVRTAANVMRNGKNHLILGGSNEAGVKRAVDQFVRLIGTSPAKKGTLALPWLLKVELGGRCLETLKQEDAKWAANPLDPSLPKVEPSNGTLQRWYENAMGYYWTGWESYRRRTLELLEPVLKDTAYPHHYSGESFVRAFDMLDGSPLLADKRAAVDKLIFANFLDAQTDNGDLSWMTTFTPPYDSVAIVNRHQIAPWMMDLAMSDFLRDYYRLSGQAKDLVDFRQSEKDSFMRSVVESRWGGSLPDILAESEEETALAIFRYALERGNYALFTSGRARQSPQLHRIDARSGAWVRPGGAFDSKYMFGVLASYYRDGRYLNLLQNLPSGPSFKTRNLRGIHEYTPGAELKPAGLDSFTGVQVPPMMPHRMRNLGLLQGIQFKEITFDPAQVFEFGSFRSGFGADDDFVSLTGVIAGDIPGIFTSFVSRGVNWLNSGGGLLTPASNHYFDQNAVSVLRTDQWPTDLRPYAAAAHLDWSADLYRSGGLAFTLDPFNETQWQRSAVWVRPGLFVVRDKVTAKQDGQFHISVNWHPTGAHTWEDGVWTSIAREGQLRITPMGQGFEVQNAQDTTKNDLRHVNSATLKSNQSVAALTVLQAFKPGLEPLLSTTLVGENATLVYSETNPEENALVAWAPNGVRGVQSDAQVVVIRPGGVQVMGGTSLEISGKKLLKSAFPLSATVDWKLGKLIVDNPSANKENTVQLGSTDGNLGKPVPLSGGSQQIDLPKGAWPSKLLSQVLRREEEAPSGTASVDKTAAVNDVLQVQDKTAQWRQAWRYDGLRQPMPVRGVNFPKPNVADLGRVVNLAEIRFGPRTKSAEPRELPAEIWTSLGDAAGMMPETDSPAWVKIPKAAEWQPGIYSGNYGEARPMANDSQILPLQDLKARYVRAAGIAELQFLDRDDIGSERPLTVRTMKQDGQQRLFIAPDFWPLYYGHPWPHDAVAMLDASGKQIYKYESPTNLQVADPLPLKPGGDLSVTLATIDAKIRVLDADGSVGKDIDLYALHQGFNEKFGRPNTRMPVGGHTLPFALGTWKQGAANPELIVSRYGYFSFVDLDSKTLKGVLVGNPYTQPALLPQGIDFSGDGTEAQISMGRGTLSYLSGPVDERIEQPGGFLFFPQIYHEQRLLEPGWVEDINGARPLLFQPVLAGQSAPGRPRYLAVSRTNYLGFYDAVNKSWSFTWLPSANIQAATIMSDMPKSLRVLAATVDGLLWDLQFDDLTQKPSKFTVRRLPDTIRKMTTDADITGKVLLIAERGLYVYDGSQAVEKLSSGAFTDARWLPKGGAGQAIIAVKEDGSIERLNFQK